MGSTWISNWRLAENITGRSHIACLCSQELRLGWKHHTEQKDNTKWQLRRVSTPSIEEVLYEAVALRSSGAQLCPDLVFIFRELLSGVQK
jgi:hypothetical protein